MSDNNEKHENNTNPNIIRRPDCYRDIQFSGESTLTIDEKCLEEVKNMVATKYNYLPIGNFSAWQVLLEDIKGDTVLIDFYVKAVTEEFSIQMIRSLFKMATFDVGKSRTSTKGKIEMKNIIT